jgi:leucyl-tRNA synthetase
MRLYYSHVGSTFVDIEWDPEAVLKYKNRVINIYKMVNRISKLKDEENKNLDRWLKSTLQRSIKKATGAFESYDLRVATNEIFFECQKNLQWYLNRGGKNKKLLNDFICVWAKLMTPVVPHLSEEIWHKYHDSFVSDESFPIFNPKDISEEDEVGEHLLSKVVEDTSEILKVTKIKPKKIFIYTSPSWKREIIRKAIKLASENKLNIGTIMKEVMSDPKMKTIAKQVSQFVSKLPGDIMKLNENDKKRYLIDIKEYDYLMNSKDYIKDVFSCDIEIFSADDKNIYDPSDKIRFAAPLKPAIYVE